MIRIARTSSACKSAPSESKSVSVGAVINDCPFAEYCDRGTIESFGDENEWGVGSVRVSVDCRSRL